MKFLSQVKGKLNIQTEYPLWTRNFSILTAGSVISIMASATLTFCMSLLVLDLTESVLIYSLYMALTQAVQIVVPVLVGPFIDRHSRRKMIYLFDFCSGGIFFLLWLLFRGGEFQPWMILVSTVLLTTISAAYSVTYQALYEFVGIRYVLLFGALLYWTAAGTEIFIRLDESAIISDRHQSVRNYLADMKETARFLKKEIGLSLITVFVVFVNFSYGIRDVVWLPYFRSLPENGYFWYMIIMGAGMCGMFAGGALMYLIKIPNAKRYPICVLLLVCAVIAIGSSLYLPFLLAALVTYLFGAFTEITHNFRTTAVHSYLRDRQRGRFFGFSVMCANIGMLGGQLFAGTASSLVSLRSLNLISAGVLSIGVVCCFLLSGRRQVRPLINLEVSPSDPSDEPEKGES